MSAAASTPHNKILVGLLLGALAGCVLNAAIAPPEGPSRVALAAAVGNALAPEPHPPGWATFAVESVAKPFGKFFMNLLFLPVIPLVFASLAVGVTRLGGQGNLGRIGVKTVGYFLVTTAFAATIGLGLVNAIRPGDTLDPEKREQLKARYGAEAKSKVEARKDVDVYTLVNMVPANPLQSLVNKEMPAIIVTAILVGIALIRIDPTRAAAVIQLLEGINLIAEFIIRLAMRVAPYGVFCLIFATTAEFGYQLLVALGAFVLTVLGGLALHLLVVLPLLVYFLGGMNPLEFFRKIKVTMVTAFSTSSSSATLPTALKNAEEELGVPKPVAHFVLPLSASMNHNGTALFEAVVVLFLAQAFQVPLTFPQQLMVLFLCVVTATGMAGVPGGSLPLIGQILAVVNVPAEAIALVIGVDRILDMCRTTVNVVADMTTAVFVARSERGAGSVSDGASPTPPASLPGEPTQ